MTLPFRSHQVGYSWLPAVGFRVQGDVSLKTQKKDVLNLAGLHLVRVWHGAVCKPMHGIAGLLSGLGRGHQSS